MSSMPMRRCGPRRQTIERGSSTRSALWAQGISGDAPIVLLRIEHIEDLAIARQLLQAHEYWQLKQLAVDLVILNERAASYVQDLQVALETAVRTRRSHPQLRADSAKGSVFVLRTDTVSPETRAVLSSVARVVFVGARGTLADQLERRTELIQCSCRSETRYAERGHAHRRRETSRARVLQRHGRIRRGRTRVRNHARRWADNAGALDQCDCQSAFRLSGGGRRRRLHLVSQQSRESADAMVERSGHRSAR